MPDKSKQQALKVSILRKIWQNQEPNTPFDIYCEKLIRYDSFLLNTSIGKIVSGEISDTSIVYKAGEEIQDNSKYYEEIDITFTGLDWVSSLIKSKVPVTFITWHYGIQGYAIYSLLKKFPNIAVFDRLSFIYGTINSYSLEELRGLGLVKMDRFLREPRPITYYIDGPPLGKTITMPIMGCPMRISTAPIQVMQAVENIQIIPVSSYFENEHSARIIFHRPPVSQKTLKNKTEEEILKNIISVLEDTQRQNAPDKIFWRFNLRKRKTYLNIINNRATSRKKLLE